MFTRCPKCGHADLPADQAFPAECPACGVILARVGSAPPARTSPSATVNGGDGDGAPFPTDMGHGLRALLWHVPERVDSAAFAGRVALLLGFALWSVSLVRMDYRDGEIAGSFMHLPLLVFHEAGHVVFRPFGEWVMVLGGTLGQLLMPLIIGVVFLWQRRDPFGAAMALWMTGVSLLDIAPYQYDALHPQLMLLSGTTGEDGPHDWMYLFATTSQVANAQRIGAMTHAVGTLVVVAALAWGAALLVAQYGRRAGLVEEES